jgi:hypothetical protein
MLNFLQNQVNFSILLKWIDLDEHSPFSGFEEVTIMSARVAIEDNLRCALHYVTRLGPQYDNTTIDTNSKRKIMCLCV